MTSTGSQDHWKTLHSSKVAACLQVHSMCSRIVIVSLCIASELHHILLYYILPVLIPYLPADYFHHLALLITATRILLSSPTRNDVELAGIMLDCFVKENSVLYGTIFLT